MTLVTLSRLVPVLLALSLLALSCQPVEGFYAHNKTSQVLTIRILDPESGDREQRVRGGQATSLSVLDDGCSGIAVVAVSEDGEEVARLDQPACDGDAWIIEEDRAYLRD